jgi:hypothetical protein
LRIFINRIPDTWEPSTIWFLAGVETIIEAALLSLLFVLVKGNL